MHRESSHTGFSLIELLVVLAVIAILTVILIPVAGKLKKTADHTTSVNNLRSLGNALHLYANEHNGLLPWVTFVDTDRTKHWRRATLAYVDLNPDDRNDVFRSPFLSPAIVDMIRENGGSDTDAHITSFAMNRNLEESALNADGSEEVRGIPLTIITDPAKTILAMDATLGANGNLTLPRYDISSGVLLNNQPKVVYNEGRDALMVDGSIHFYEGEDTLGRTPYNEGGPNDVWTP
jgi:prepilin-type N-terminal cleavage/methylation domain-containing protein